MAETSASFRTLPVNVANWILAIELNSTIDDPAIQEAQDEASIVSTTARIPVEDAFDHLRALEVDNLHMRHLLHAIFGDDPCRGLLGSKQATEIIMRTNLNCEFGYGVSPRRNW